MMARADLPNRVIFMLSQNGRAKANPLNMHTKALIRPFEKSSGAETGIRRETAALHAASVRVITCLP
jgi:hypothetical protein